MFARSSITRIENSNEWAVVRHIPKYGWRVIHRKLRLDDAILACAVSNLNLPVPNPEMIIVHRLISTRDWNIWSRLDSWIHEWGMMGDKELFYPRKLGWNVSGDGWRID